MSADSEGKLVPNMVNVSGTVSSFWGLVIDTSKVGCIVNECTLLPGLVLPIPFVTVTFQ